MALTSWFSFLNTLTKARQPTEHCFMKGIKEGSKRGFLCSLDKLVSSSPHIIARLLQAHHNLGRRVSLHLQVEWASASSFISPDSAEILYNKGSSDEAKKYLASQDKLDC